MYISYLLFFGAGWRIWRIIGLFCCVAMRGLCMGLVLGCEACCSPPPRWLHCERVPAVLWDLQASDTEGQGDPLKTGTSFAPKHKECSKNVFICTYANPMPIRILNVLLVSCITCSISDYICIWHELDDACCSRNLFPCLCAGCRYPSHELSEGLGSRCAAQIRGKAFDTRQLEMAVPCRFQMVQIGSGPNRLHIGYIMFLQKCCAKRELNLYNKHSNKAEIGWRKNVNNAFQQDLQWDFVGEQAEQVFVTGQGRGSLQVLGIRLFHAIPTMLHTVPIPIRFVKGLLDWNGWAAERGAAAISKTTPWLWLLAGHVALVEHG